MNIDAHKVEGRGTSCTHSQDFKKLGHTNAIRHKNMKPFVNFLTTPCTSSKDFENDCAPFLIS
jgi:hypothetical protein